MSADLGILADREIAAHGLGRNICATCNNGWLSEIDRSCQTFLSTALLSPVTRQEISRELAVHELNALKTFVYKIALNYLSTSPFADKRQNLFRLFYKSQCPPENTVIFDSAYMGTDAIDLAYSNDWFYKSVDAVNLSAKIAFLSSFESSAFKFYVKLGYLAFVIANSSDFPMIFDPNIIAPFVQDDKQVVLMTLPIVPVPKEHVGDGVASRILYSLGFAEKTYPDAHWISDIRL